MLNVTYFACKFNEQVYWSLALVQSLLMVNVVYIQVINTILLNYYNFFLNQHRNINNSKLI